MRKADVQRREAIAAEQAKLQKAERDKKSWELINVEPEAAYQPFNRQVIDAANVVRKQTADELTMNPALAENARYRAEVKRRWENVNELSRRSNYIKAELQGTRDYIAKAPYLRPEYYHSKLNDLYLNPDGTAKNLNDINVDDIRNVYITDPRGFNETAYAKDFKGGLNDNMSNYITQRAMNNGILTEDREAKWKGNLYTPDPNSAYGVKVDANGDPILNDTPEVYNSYLNSDLARRYYQSLADEQGVDIKDVVRPQLINAAGLQQQVRPSWSRNPMVPKWQYEASGGGGFSEDDARLSRRVFDYIDNTSNAFYDKDGNRLSTANPQAREAVGHFRNKKFGGGTISEADLVAGTNKQGKSQVLGSQIENSPNDRLILKIRGTNGKTTLEEINLADEGGPAELWNLYQQTEYFGKKKIAFDDAVDKLGITPSDLYKGRQYLGENQEQEQALINQMSAGQGVDLFKGKSINGKAIKSVEPETERTWRHPIDGEFTSYRVKLEDGSEVVIGKEDVDAFQNVLRSKGKVETAGKKKTGVTWE